MGRIAAVLCHLKQWTFLQVHCVAFAAFVLEVTAHDIDMIGKRFDRDCFDHRSH